jgi:hypothetical protein
MVVRHVEPELVALEVDPELRREADEEPVDPVLGNDAPGFADRARELGLERLPLGGERLVPVRGEELAEVATVRVRDASRKTGFRLVGPGIRRATGTGFTGSVTWRVRLARGTYRYGAGSALRTFTVS